MRSEKHLSHLQVIFPSKWQALNSKFNTKDKKLGLGEQIKNEKGMSITRGILGSNATVKGK